MRWRREAMKGRILVVGAACVAAAVIAAFAQFNVGQAENPPAVDESKPATVTTPTSDAEAREAGEPLVPQAPGESPRTEAGETMQPEPVAPAEEARETIQPEPIAPAEEAAAADQARIPAEPARKLWRITPIFGVGVLYDDNIFLTNTNRVADVIWRIPVGFALEVGDFQVGEVRGGKENYLNLQWIGVPVFYTDNPEQNSFNQSYSLRAQYRWSRLVGRLESSFSIAREANRELNTIATTKSFSNNLHFHYDYSAKTSFFVGFSQLATIVESSSGPQPQNEGQNNYQYESRAGVDYQMFPKTNLGFEGVGGVLDSPSSPLQYYQQARLRVNYGATGKLSFKFSGGIEVREFQGGEMTKISPVFSLGLSYQPFDGTTLGIVGYRNIVGSSAVDGQDITATGFELALQQRLFQKFEAGISFGFEHDEYFATSEQSPTDRVDNYAHVRPSLRYSLVRWVSAGVYYEFRKTVSTQATRSFYDNRIGIEIVTNF
jgi:hypothetical protein